VASSAASIVSNSSGGSNTLTTEALESVQAKVEEEDFGAFGSTPVNLAQQSHDPRIGSEFSFTQGQLSTTGMSAISSLSSGSSMSAMSNSKILGGLSGPLTNYGDHTPSHNTNPNSNSDNLNPTTNIKKYSSAPIITGGGDYDENEATYYNSPTSSPKLTPSKNLITRLRTFSFTKKAGSDEGDSNSSRDSYDSERSHSSGRGVTSSQRRQMLLNNILNNPMNGGSAGDAAEGGGGGLSGQQGHFGPGALNLSTTGNSSNSGNSGSGHRSPKRGGRGESSSAKSSNSSGSGGDKSSQGSPKGSPHQDQRMFLRSSYKQNSNNNSNSNSNNNSGNNSVNTNSDSEGEREKEKENAQHIDYSFWIDINELVFDMDHNNEKRVIGRGAYASIHLASWNGTPCAVKRIFEEKAGEMLMQKFHSEIAMMGQLRHPNIIQTYGAHFSKEDSPESDPRRLGGASSAKSSLDDLVNEIGGGGGVISGGGVDFDNATEQSGFSTCIIMEYAQHGSLNSLLKNHGTEVGWYPSDNIHEEVSELRRQTKLSWAIQVARGMVYLHSQKKPIMHRDLKASNVLVSQGYCMKVCDFGDSKALDRMSAGDNSETGTLLFMAPEIVTASNYTTKVDVYR